MLGSLTSGISSYRAAHALIRNADDFVIGAAREDNARRIMDVLPKRMSKYNSTVHPEKTRLIRFHSDDPDDSDPSAEETPLPRSFDFLGFTHYWGKAWKGGSVIKRKTAKSRLKRAFQALSEWCRLNRHEPIATQHQTLKQNVPGQYGYYGITGNVASLQEFREGVKEIWKSWLSRRRRAGPMTWPEFSRLERWYRLPQARVVHSLLG